MRCINNLKVFSLFKYSDFRNYYIRFKYYKDCRYNNIFEQAVNDYMIDIIIDDFIFLPPKKSHNIDILVKLLARKFTMPYYYCFDYTRDVVKNCKLDAWQRHHNVKNAMSVKNLPPNFCYVLFDDIVTSGSTLLEMRRALIDYGVSSDNISAITFFDALL